LTQVIVVTPTQETGDACLDGMSWVAVNGAASVVTVTPADNASNTNPVWTCSGSEAVLVKENGPARDILEAALETP